MSKNKLTINYLNVYHLFNKVHEINVELTKKSQTIHILGLSETRLDDKIDDSNVEIQNYVLLRRDKQIEGHTGLAVYIHNSILQFTRRRHDLESKEVESVWLEVKIKTSKPFLICFVYRNPRATVQWLDTFETMIDNVPDKDIDIIIEGDLNIDLNKPQPIWNNLITSLGLSQLINDITRTTSKTKKDRSRLYQ